MCKERHKGSIAWMASNPVAANLLMLMLIVGGLLVGLHMRKEVFPQVELDQIYVSVVYPGASPAEVEQGIILAIEEVTRTLDGVKEIRSTAREGMGSVSIELDVGTNREKALTDVKSAVDRIASFPKDIERPQVMLPEFRREAISVILYGAQEEGVLREMGEQVRNELLQLAEVSLVELSGVRSLEIAVEISEDNLRQYNLTLEQIAQVVRRTAIEIPGGGVKTEGGEILLRTAERRDWGAEFKDIPVIYGRSESPVRLDEIASIQDGFSEEENFIYFNGKPAVMVNVYSVGEQSPTDVGAVVKLYVEELKMRLPPGIEVATWKDRTKIFEERINLLLRNASLGLVLVLIILGLFLDPKLAFWVSLGIPISFLGSFIFLPTVGISINMISMFAFIITLGMVVDDAIVVGENTYRLQKQGVPFLQAAIQGAREVSMPVFFSIATTIAAFSPLLFLPGTHGKFTFSIPAIVLLVLSISLIESFFVLPAHLAHRSSGYKRSLFSPIMDIQARFSQGVETFIVKRFRPLISTLLRHRKLVVATSAAIFFISHGFVAGGQIKFIDFPKEESDWVTAQVIMPYGIALAETKEVMDKMVNAAQTTLDELGGDSVGRGIMSTLGFAMGGGHRTGANSRGSHLTSVQVGLVPTNARDFSSFEYADKWRARIGMLVGVETMSFVSTLRGSSKPIDIEMSHQDYQVLEAAARDLSTRLSAFEGVHDIDNGIELGKPQWDFTISPQGTHAGLTAFDLAAQVRSAFYGVIALRQQRGRNEVKVMVRRPRDERESLYSVEEMMVRTPSGGEMPLQRAADIRQGYAYTTVQRTNGRRTIRLQADVKEGQANPQEVVRFILNDMAPELRARYPGLAFGLAGRQQDMHDFFAFLLVGFGMALLAIYGLLAIPLRSYLQPAFVVMAVVPFGYVGAIWGHLAMGIDFSFFSIMGIVALSGVVVNDSIVLVHTANRFRAKGEAPMIAAIRASEQRFRPIILTTLTTFGGLSPLIFETSLQARILIPMAVSLGFGILISTFFVLFLVPALFVLVENLRIWDAKRKSGASDIQLVSAGETE